jgi:hypothetical protein
MAIMDRRRHPVRGYPLLLAVLGLSAFVCSSTGATDSKAVDPVQIVFAGSGEKINRRAVAAAGRRRASRIRNAIAEGRMKSTGRARRGRLLSTDGWEDSFEDDVHEKGDRDCDDFEHQYDGGYNSYNGDTNASFLNPCQDDPYGVEVGETDDTIGGNSSTGNVGESYPGYPVADGDGSSNGSRPFDHWGDNHVMVKVYVALRPNEASRGALVTQVLSLYLNASTDLWVDIREHYENRSGWGQEREGGGSGGQEREFDGEPERYDPQTWEGGGWDVGGDRDDEGMDMGLGEGGIFVPANTTYIVQHHHTDSELEATNTSNWWWWQYEMWYDCFAPNTSAVLEREALNGIERLMHQSLQSGIDSGDLYNWMMTTYNGTFGALELTTKKADVFTSDASAIPDNSSQVFLTVYVALRPGDPSRRTLITKVLSSYLTETNPRFRFELDDDQVYDAEEQQEFIGDDNTARRQLRSVQQVGQNWTMDHFSTYCDTVNKKRRLWWWEYNLVYECFRGDSGEPVTDLASLEAISTLMKQTIQDGIDSGDIYQWLRDRFRGGTIGIMNMTTDSSIFGGREGGSSDSGSSSSSSSSSSSDSSDPAQAVDPEKRAEYLTPVNPSEWNWLRYLGLGIFVGTVLVTFILMHLAAYRHRSMAKQELWGNLGTVKGVEEVLQTGWTIKGSNMEIYDKSKVGYDDDHGSLLIGGFEQRVILGAEITVERFHGSEATPETHPYSFTHGTVSEYPSEHLRLPDSPSQHPKEKPVAEVKPGPPK